MLRLRPATAADADFLLELRNSPDVRAASRSADPIGQAEHRGWLEAVLASHDRILLIAEAGGRPVGQARLDRVPAGGWEISVALVADARGGGAGTRLIDAAVQWLRGLGEAEPVTASVRDDNVASQIAFARAGFIEDGRGKDGLLRFTRR